MGNDFFETLEQIETAKQTGTPLLGIGNRCYIERAIIDKDCRIGDDVKIIGGKHLADADTPLYTIKEGIVVVKKGAILPNGFTIG
jgi:glucose-1-phosphate adenylyltransferase